MGEARGGRAGAGVRRRRRRRPGPRAARGTGRPGGRRTGRADGPDPRLLGPRPLAGPGPAESRPDPAHAERPADHRRGPVAGRAGGDLRRMAPGPGDVPDARRPRRDPLRLLLVQQPGRHRSLGRRGDRPDPRAGRARGNRPHPDPRLGLDRRAVGLPGVPGRRMAAPGRDRAGHPRDRPARLGLFAARSCCRRWSPPSPGPPRRSAWSPPNSGPGPSRSP